jgi:hypothetical protein
MGPKLRLTGTEWYPCTKAHKQLEQGKITTNNAKARAQPGTRHTAHTTGKEKGRVVPDFHLKAAQEKVNEVHAAPEE